VSLLIAEAERNLIELCKLAVNDLAMRFEVYER
jgi:hypothetical protein